VPPNRRFQRTASLRSAAAETRVVSRGRSVTGHIKGIAIQELVGRCNNVGVESQAGRRSCPCRRRGKRLTRRSSRHASLRVRLSGRALGTDAVRD